MKTRIVGRNFPDTLVHGTTQKSAKAFIAGEALSRSEVQRTMSEWGEDVIYASEWTAPHQALMFGVHGGTGFGGRTIIEFELHPGDVVADIADEVQRRGLEAESGAQLLFCGRPSWTDDMAVWLNESRVSRGRESFSKAKAVSIVDPTHPDFHGHEYLPMLAHFMRDRGFSAIRLTDETVILNRDVIIGARRLSRKEIEKLAAVPRAAPAISHGSLFTRDCERATNDNPPITRLDVDDLQSVIEGESGFVVMYRGTGADGLKTMRPSDEGVYGMGIYFYNNPIDAAVYSERNGGVIVVVADPDHVKRHGEIYVAPNARVIQVVGVIPNNDTGVKHIAAKAHEILTAWWATGNNPPAKLVRQAERIIRKLEEER